MKDCYARNYLFPKNLAREATAGNLMHREVTAHIKVEVVAQGVERIDEAEAAAVAPASAHAETEAEA